DVSAGRITVPEGHLRGFTGSRGNDYAVMGDFLHPPGAGSQKECFTRSRFKYHFLIQLSYSALARPGSSEKNAIKAAVRNRPCIGNRNLFCSLPRTHYAANPVPNDPWTKLAEFIRWIKSR